MSREKEIEEAISNLVAAVEFDVTELDDDECSDDTKRAEDRLRAMLRGVTKPPEPQQPRAGEAEPQLGVLPFTHAEGWRLFASAMGSLRDDGLPRTVTLMRTGDMGRGVAATYLLPADLDEDDELPCGPDEIACGGVVEVDEATMNALLAATPQREAVAEAGGLDAATVSWMRRDVQQIAEIEKRGELLAAQRAELCLAYDIIDTIPQSALENVSEAKLLEMMRKMDEEQKRATIRDRMSALAEENEALRDRLSAATPATSEARAAEVEADPMLDTWRQSVAETPVKSCGSLDMSTYLPSPVKVGRVESDVIRYVYFADGSEVIVLGKFADHVAFRAWDYEALRLMQSAPAAPSAEAVLRQLRHEFACANHGSIPDHSGPGRESIRALSKSNVLSEIDKQLALLATPTEGKP